VKAGIEGARQALLAGCNDLGGTLMDENISRAAGASHGQELDDDDLRAIVEPLGRTLVQRTTLYGRATTVGSRLRPPPEQIEADRVATAAAAVTRQHRAHAHARSVTERSVASPRLDVVGIGNALVDVLSYESDDFVVKHDLVRGAMTLIDTERAETLYAAMGPAREVSGGSAANSMVGVVSFGGTAAFVGRSATINWARSSDTTSGPPAWSSRPRLLPPRPHPPDAASSSSRPTRSAP